MPRKGENIYKRKDGRWEGRYVKGRDGKKAIYGYVYSKSYSEVKKQLILKRAEYALENNKPSVSTMKDALFSDLSEMWLRSIQSSVKESTWIKYRNILKCNVVPRLGNKNLSEIDYSVVSTFCNNLMESGGKDQSGLAAKTVADALSLKVINRYAASGLLPTVLIEKYIRHKILFGKFVVQYIRDDKIYLKTADLIRKQLLESLNIVRDGTTCSERKKTIDEIVQEITGNTKIPER